MLKASAFVGVILVFSGGLGCGGDSGGSRTGTGGSTGSGGSATGTGGSTTGTGGSTTGTGGFTGVGFPCTPALAPNMNITDFTDANATGRWGTAPTTLTGGTFSYGALTSAVDVAAHNYKMSGTVAGYAGGGLYLDLCTDASRFTGIQFVVEGDLGGCLLELQVQTNSDKPVETNGMKGTCPTDSGCVSPAARMLTAPGAIAVSWSALMGGTPNPFSANGNKEIVGIQWQLTTATTCSPNITIDSVAWTM